MSLPSLYEISREYRAEVEKLADLDLPPEVIEDTLSGLSGDLEVKGQAVAAFIKNLEATAAAIKEAEAGMAARRKALENRAARVKDYLLASMMVAGVKKIECPLLKLTVRDNPPAVEVYEPGLIPSEFMRQPEPPPPAPDKAALKEAMKAGQEIPGARLTHGMRLEIRA